MAKTREQKQEIVQKLESAMKAAETTVFVHFSKVTVAEESAMRRDLRKEGIGYTVARKTLIRRALDSLGLNSADATLDGEVALAYGGTGDATAPARSINEFGKKLTDRLTILGGIFEGKLVGAAQMHEIATIPSVKVLHGMFANVINSPIAGLAIALKALADKQA